MCGIVGILENGRFGDQDAVRRVVAEMRDRIAHRGPDDDGVWLDGEGGLAFGFRRLSIVDLTAAGHQPMLSADGRYAVVFNGEIYNHADLRAEVEAAPGGPGDWHGHSDTEVLVEAVAAWGVERALSRLNGMFAFAVWDRRDRVLWLARDRAGEKPLYYGWAGDAFVFGSELKALWAHPRFDFRVSRDAVAGFMELGYVPGESSIFAGVSKLRAGHLLRLGPADVARRALPAPAAYWSLREAALAGLEAQAAGRPADEEELDALVRDAVARRMVADVPVGAFLSGGVDSSLVTAVMAADHPAEVRTFTIGFRTAGWDEAPHARAVAAHLGTRHEELYVGEAELTEVVRELPRICDEPLADDSLIPTTLLSRLTRRSVTVALSGDGGDELFAGYQRYEAAERWLARGERVPALLRPPARRAVEQLRRAAGRWGSQRVERRLRLVGRLLGGDGGPEAFQNAIMAQHLDPGSLLAAPGGPPGAFPARLAGDAYVLGRSAPVDRMTFMDTASYLVDDILMKVDRASMSTSLEVRCPLLDHRVIEMSWRFPVPAKVRAGTGKLPLRNLLYRRVPRELVDRPKMGFSAPIETWIRGSLRDWAEALMTREALGAHGLLDVGACRRLWERFTREGRGWDRAIWTVLVLQAWHAEAAAAARAAGRALLADDTSLARPAWAGGAPARPAPVRGAAPAAP